MLEYKGQKISQKKQVHKKLQKEKKKQNTLKNETRKRKKGIGRILEKSSRKITYRNFLNKLKILRGKQKKEEYKIEYNNNQIRTEMETVLVWKEYFQEKFKQEAI